MWKTWQQITGCKKLISCIIELERRNGNVKKVKVTKLPARVHYIKVKIVK